MQSQQFICKKKKITDESARREAHGEVSGKINVIGEAPSELQGSRVDGWPEGEKSTAVEEKRNQE